MIFDYLEWKIIDRWWTFFYLKHKQFGFWKCTHRCEWLSKHRFFRTHKVVQRVHESKQIQVSPFLCWSWNNKTRPRGRTGWHSITERWYDSFDMITAALEKGKLSKEVLRKGRFLVHSLITSMKKNCIEASLGLLKITTTKLQLSTRSARAFLYGRNFRLKVAKKET